jgi:uncharacterized phage protein (TIGR01671 family)
MREIKFRAIRAKENSWVYGFYSPIIIPIIGGLGHVINEGGYRAVDIKIETLGQLTGLTDRNGKEIYEGDIVTSGIAKQQSTVKFIDGSFAFVYEHHSTCARHFDIKGVEVIGNVHENKELIGN